MLDRYIDKVAYKLSEQMSLYLPTVHGLIEEFDKFKGTTWVKLNQIESLYKDPSDKIQALSLQVNSVKAEIAFQKTQFSIKKLQ